MALSNIWREPRREITESAIGMAVATPPIVAVVWSAAWFAKWSGPENTVGSCPPWFFRFFIGVVLASAALATVYFVLMGLLVWTHGIGEDVCAFLARRGKDPRPKVRR